MTIWTDVVFVRDYHPYRVQGQRNPAFNADDGRVLDLKDNLDQGITAAIRDMLPKLTAATLPPGILITAVPGHEARPTNAQRALARVAAGLATQLGNGAIDVPDALLRVHTIDKLATGGDRSIGVHLGSIQVQNAAAVAGHAVLVLDDVTTSGNSLKACRQLLVAAGASAVAALALGKTV